MRNLWDPPAPLAREDCQERQPTPKTRLLTARVGLWAYVHLGQLSPPHQTSEPPTAKKDQWHLKRNDETELCQVIYLSAYVQQEPSSRRKAFFFKIYFWLCWVFVAVRGLSLVVVSGGYSSLRCAGFSLRWLLLLQSTGSRCMGFSSCGSRV